MKSLILESINYLIDQNLKSPIAPSAITIDQAIQISSEKVLIVYHAGLLQRVTMISNAGKDNGWDMIA